MNETKIHRIKNNLEHDSPLNIEKMKKKISYIHNILNQVTVQNFKIPYSDLTNFYNKNIITYNKKINLLVKYLKNSSFPQNLNYYNGYNITPPTTPDRQLTINPNIIEIEATPERMKQHVKTFHRRYLYTTVNVAYIFFSK